MDADYGNAGDETLVKACLAGEPAAVEALIVRYTKAAFAVALSRLGSRQDAEDVAQETFVTAIRTLHTLKDPPRVGAWLCGIARHKALNWSARWRRPGTVSWESLAAGEGSVKGVRDVADAIAAAELRSIVRAAIAGLTPLQRDAIALHYVGGYRLGEMADLLGVPLGTVKRRLHDARRRLKGELLVVVGDELRKSGPSEDLGARIRKVLRASDPVAEAADRAIREGDLEALRLLLREHPGLAASRIVDEKGVSGSLLHTVAGWPGFFPNGAAVVRLLIGAGAEPNGADPNARIEGVSYHTETPLHWAASSDDLDVADALIQGGADIDASGGSIGSPLENAVGYACWQVAHRLVWAGAKVTNLWTAAALGLMSRIEELFAADPGPTAEEINHAFNQACCGGQPRAAAYLLARGADPQWTPDYAEDRTTANAAEGGGTRWGILQGWLRERGLTAPTDE